MPSECRQRPRSAYKTPFRIGRRGQHNPVHFISARFACGLEHGTLAAALRQKHLRKSIALAAQLPTGSVIRRLAVPIGMGSIGVSTSLLQFKSSGACCYTLIASPSSVARTPDELKHCAHSLADLSTGHWQLQIRKSFWQKSGALANN